MPRYCKKPVEIEAVQWDGTADGATPIVEWITAAGAAANYLCSNPDRCAGTDGDTPHYIEIHTLEGDMRADLGDWIVKGVQGEFYPCKPDIFEATYEPADGSREATAAVIEIVEKNRTTDDTTGGSVIVPNEVRINGIPLLIPADQQIKVHDMTFNNGRGDEFAWVTLTLFVRRVTIAAEGDLA